jgi:hypothetical protein
VRLKVIENSLLRRISERKREEVIGGWIKSYIVELHNLYCSPNVIRMIRSRRTTCAGHVARMEEPCIASFCRNM